MISNVKAAGKRTARVYSEETQSGRMEEEFGEGIKIEIGKRQGGEMDLENVEEMVSNPFEAKREHLETVNQEARRKMDMAFTQNLVALQGIPPPLTEMFHATVTRNIKAQAELSNRLILQILFEKYDLMSILTHFKQIFLGQRGDCTEGFVDLVYGEGMIVGPGEIKARSLLNLTEYFNGWRYSKTEEIDWEFSFSFKLNRKLDSQELENAGVVNTNINEIVKVSCTLPSPVSILMSE